MLSNKSVPYVFKHVHTYDMLDPVDCCSLLLLTSEVILRHCQLVDRFCTVLSIINCP